MSDCLCFQIRPGLENFDVVLLGDDETNSGCTDVEVHTCHKCGAKWVYYHVEFPQHSQSGKSYRGLISDEVAETVTRTTAAAALNESIWLFQYGYVFNGRTKPPVNPYSY